MPVLLHYKNQQYINSISIVYEEIKKDDTATKQLLSSSITKQKEVTIIKREDEDISNNDSSKIILQYAIENTLPIAIIHSILNSCPYQ